MIKHLGVVSERTITPRALRRTAHRNLQRVACQRWHSHTWRRTWVGCSHAHAARASPWLWWFSNKSVQVQAWARGGWCASSASYAMGLQARASVCCLCCCGCCGCCGGCGDWRAHASTWWWSCACCESAWMHNPKRADGQTLHTASALLSAHITLHETRFSFIMKLEPSSLLQNEHRKHCVTRKHTVTVRSFALAARRAAHPLVIIMPVGLQILVIQHLTACKARPCNRVSRQRQQQTTDYLPR